MNIHLENYFGENIISLTLTNNKTMKDIINISIKYGFNFADEDEDDNGNKYIRLQLENKSTSNNEMILNIKKIINELI